MEKVIAIVIVAYVIGVTMEVVVKVIIADRRTVVKSMPILEL